MHALVDCDVMVYEIASLRDDEGYPLAWPLIEKTINDHINTILEDTEAETWEGFLTGKGNFREQIATILPYKGQRKRGERPFWYSAVYNYLVNERRVSIIDGREADDELSIRHNASGGNTIICSRDKDLLQVPGWHYQWPFGKKQEPKLPFYIDEIQGLRNFYCQLLTGDSTDNILGLFGVGPKAACVSRIKEYEDELQMFKEVKTQYELRFGSYWEQFMCENGRLLWMLRHEGDDWYGRQRELMGRELMGRCSHSEVPAESS